jgi:hypothetical protein
MIMQSADQQGGEMSGLGELARTTSTSLLEYQIDMFRKSMDRTIYL